MFYLTLSRCLAPKVIRYDGTLTSVTGLRQVSGKILTPKFGRKL